MSEWIEIKEGCEMPKAGQAVWCYDSYDGGIFQANFTEENKFFAHRWGWGNSPATHWMPRFTPAPPEPNPVEAEER